MFGEEALHIDTAKNELVARTWQNSVLQISRRQTIGVYVFGRGVDTEIYHNLHAHKERQLSKEFCEQIQDRGFDQHFFYYDYNGRPTTMYLAGKQSP